MRGQQVKEILQNNGYSLKEVATSMGETPQNFQAMLKVEDIKTGVLERIANAINKNLMFFFSDDLKDNDEMKVINEIIYNQKQIHQLYQKVVDVEILIKDYLKIKDDYDYIADAALIMNTMTWDKNAIWKYPDADNLEKKYETAKLASWRDFDLSEKKIYCMETKEAVRNLNDIFFSRFKVLYKHMRGFS